MKHYLFLAFSISKVVVAQPLSIELESTILVKNFSQMQFTFDHKPSFAILLIFFHLNGTITTFVYRYMHSPQILNNGNLYYLSIMDDFSKFVWLFPMSSKLIVNSIFLQFKIQIKFFLNTLLNPSK